MAKMKRKVNAGKFLEDLRSGKSPEELMGLHDLNAAGLDQLLKKLVERGHLSPSEIARSNLGRAAKASASRQPEEPALTPGSERPSKKPPTEELGRSLTQCPQCGARVSERALICPECGHVLPGEERWARTELKPKLTERIPPVMIGCIIAIPIGIALFIFFRYVALPAREAQVEQRIEQLRKETPGDQAPMQVAEQHARGAALRIVGLELERLRIDGVFTRSNQDFTSFTAGDRWMQASNQDRVTWVNMIGRAMRQGKLNVEFDVVDQSGQVLAEATETLIQIINPDGMREFFDPSYEPQ